jgi:CDP-glycerol glycerophosphotransferase (TagB/SpsB family)
MKIDKTNPRHWLILLRSSALLTFALPARLVPRRAPTKVVVLYGHRLNGNLLPLHELNDRPGGPEDLTFYYLSIDPDHLEDLRPVPRVLSGLRFRDLVTLVRADVVVTSHGLHHFEVLRRLTDIRFVDVWHGIPYKGFAADEFRLQHTYDEVWVSSEEMARTYVDRFGFTPGAVHPVGYARVERLLGHPESRAEILRRYGLVEAPTVLIAPTWQQDDPTRSIVPFGLGLGEFVDRVARAHPEWQFVFRAHLNVTALDEVHVPGNVRVMPAATHPVAEDFLRVADVLVTDWSSIAFDYLPLGRPVVYVDTPAPFHRGFSLGPEHRFGRVAASADELDRALEEAVSAPEAYQCAHEEARRHALAVAYGTTLDGRVLERSVDRLRRLTS